MKRKAQEPKVVKAPLDGVYGRFETGDMVSMKDAEWQAGHHAATGNREAASAWSKAIQEVK